MTYFSKSAGGDDASFAKVITDVKAKGHKVLEVLTYDDDGEHHGEILALQKNGSVNRYEFSGRVASAELEAAATAIYRQQAKAELAALNAAFAKKEQEAPAVTTKAKAPSAQSFETHVYAIKARDGCSKQEALRQARREHPDAFEAWQGGRTGDNPVTKAREAIANGRAATAKAFEDRVNEVKQRDKCNKQAAMRTAREEFPDEYAAFQNA